MFFRLAIAVLLIVSVGVGTVEVNAEASAGEIVAPAHKVLVVAKIEEEAKRRALEDQVRLDLQEKGVESILGSDVMSEADFASEETIRNKVESLGVDGVLGYVVLGVDESVKTSSASVSVGVGVPVGIGPFSVFVGGSVPLGGGEPKVTRKVRIRARYFASPFAAPAWEKVYNETLTDDTTSLIQYLASSSVKALKKKKLIPK
jgi:hypothetical protein